MKKLTAKEDVFNLFSASTSSIVLNAKISLHDMPLVVISREYWDAMPGFSESENQQAWQMWQEMQTELLLLSSTSRQVIATESEHHVQLQQPELIINSINDLMQGKQ